MRRLGLWLMTAALLAGPVRADTVSAPRIQTELQPAKATVGQPVEVHISVTLPPRLSTVTPRFPVWDGGWGDAEVISATTPRRVPVEDTGVRWSQVVKIAAFETGSVGLPPRQVVVPESKRSLSLSTPSSLALTVVSVLPEGAKPASLQPKPSAPLRALPWGGSFWWTLGLGLLALLASVWWGRRRASSLETEAQVSPAAPPLDELRTGLEALATISDPLAFHTELSRVLRRFLGRALGFPAVESTTTEIRRRLTGVHLGPDLVRQTVHLLRRCDEVKFARRRHEEGLDTLARQAAGIGEQVESHLRPAVPDSPEERAA